MYILAIIALIALVVPPVFAAGEEPTDEATLYYNRGALLLNGREYQGAVDLFDLALASNTTRISMSDALLYTYRNKGYAQIQLGKYDDALQTLGQGLALYPRDSMLWNNKGYVYQKLRNYPDALAAYNTAIRLDNNFTTSFINKGDTLFLMGRYQEAADTYNAALATDSGNKDATVGLAATRQATAAAIPTTMIVIVILVIIVAGGAVWYIKYKKPARKPEEKRSRGKKE